VDPAQAADEPDEFAPDSVGINWDLALRDGELGSYTMEGQTFPSSVDFTFFDGLLTPEDHDAGRYCMVQMPMSGAGGSEAIPSAWLQFQMPTDGPAEQLGQCEAGGHFGVGPVAWLGQQTLVVGVGPLTEEMRAHVEKMWPQYGPTWGDSLESALPYLVGGPLLLDGVVRDWAFGTAVVLDEDGAVVLDATDRPVRVPAEDLSAAEGSMLLSMFGARPHTLTE